ncbi:MAG: hypothetical protein NE327_09155 [Lentisphaeraceae bacterium]|nr:hypothetical protein [Lentisphaeraceae bacterium]
MAAKTFGTVHLYGVNGTHSDATVLSVNKTKNHALEDQTENESGVVIERRYDDETEEITLTCRFQSGYTSPSIGTTFAYDGTTYEVTQVANSEENKGYRTEEISGKKSEGVSYS